MRKQHLQHMQLLGVLAAAMISVESRGAEARDGVEEIVVNGSLGRYSATKSNTPIMETARSLSIETRQDLLDQGALNLADAYLYSAGVIGERYGFSTRGDSVAVRGQNVPEYRDSLQALFGNYNNTRPDIYTIEQVEILKGPASVLYGQGSAGGIVNVVSKTPQQDSFNEVVAELGNFDRRQLALDSTGRLDEAGQWLYRVNLVYRDSDSQVDYVGENAWTVAPSISWRPSAVTNLTLLASLQETDSDTAAQFHSVYGTHFPAPNGEYLDFDTYTGEPGFNRYDTQSNSLTLLADHELNSHWSLEATARYTKGESDYQQAWHAFIGGDRYVYNADGSLYKGGSVPRTFYIAHNQSEQRALDVRARARFMTGSFDHELLMGVMYQEVTTQSNSASLYALGYDLETGRPDDVLGDRFWINVFDPVYSGDVPDQSLIDSYYSISPEGQTQSVGYYINDQITLGNLNLQIGLRHDEVETDNGTLIQQDDASSYSVGGLYRLPGGLSPYLSYAESFQPVVGLDNVTDAPLKPQEGEQWEAGIKFQPQGAAAYVTLAWFAIEVSNLSNPNAIVGAGSQQEGISKTDGLELELRVPFSDFVWEFNASLVDSRNVDGFQRASLPEKQASSWLNYRPSGTWQGFKAGLGIRYVGESWDGLDTLKTPSYTLADFMIGYETENWHTTFNIRNVLDKTYQATCLARGDCFMGENRTAVLRIARHF